MVNMPRFFFNIRNGDDYIADPDGTELADLDAAVEEALTGARELLSEIKMRWVTSETSPMPSISWTMPRCL